MANKVYCRDIDENYLWATVDSTLLVKQVQQIQKCVLPHEWIWEHELFACVKEGKHNGYFKVHHTDDLDEFINGYINYYKTEIMKKFETNFKHMNIVNIDALSTESTPFWQSMSSIIDGIDVGLAIEKTNNWIDINNRNHV